LDNGRVEIDNNRVEPFAYLKVTLTAITNGHPQSGIGDLIP